MDSRRLSPTQAASLEASSPTIVTMNSEQLSPSRTHQGSYSEASFDTQCLSPFWLKEVLKVWEPYLKAFTLFPKLPIEVRQAIWKFTLKPRVVEIEHNCERGYYSRVNVPVALRVTKDSRSAVGFLYPLCFGSVLHKPRIILNFSMDTLYFDEMMWTEVPKFLTGLKDNELSLIQFIAADRFIDEVREWDDIGFNPYDNMNCLQTAAAAMPALKEFLLVVKIDEMWYEHVFPDGSGPIELYEDFPWDLQQICADDHWDGEDIECKCQELPTYDDILKGLNVPIKGSIWGWRPTKTSP